MKRASTYFQIQTKGIHQFSVESLTHILEFIVNDNNQLMTRHGNTVHAAALSTQAACFFFIQERLA
jgi:hypothetical protein